MAMLIHSANYSKADVSAEMSTESIKWAYVLSELVFLELSRDF